MRMTESIKTALLTMTTLSTAVGAVHAQTDSELWQEISAVKNRKTHLIPLLFRGLI